MRIVSANILRDLILQSCPRLNEGDVNVPDRDYALLERRHLDQLGKYVRQVLWAFRVLRWAPFFDCDDYARLAHLCASLMHRAAMAKAGKVSPEAAAFGSISYYRGGSPFEGHRLNFVVLDDMTVKAWEPQTQTFTALTDLEWASAWGVGL